MTCHLCQAVIAHQSGWQQTASDGRIDISGQEIFMFVITLMTSGLQIRKLGATRCCKTFANEQACFTSEEIFLYSFLFAAEFLSMPTDCRNVSLSLLSGFEMQPRSPACKRKIFIRFMLFMWWRFITWCYGSTGQEPALRPKSNVSHLLRMTTCDWLISVKNE